MLVAVRVFPLFASWRMIAEFSDGISGGVNISLSRGVVASPFAVACPLALFFGVTVKAP